MTEGLGKVGQKRATFSHINRPLASYVNLCFFLRKLILISFVNYKSIACDYSFQYREKPSIIRNILLCWKHSIPLRVTEMIVAINIVATFRHYLTSELAFVIRY